MKPEHERAREIGERLGEMDEYPCPCLHTTPCHPRCTCVHQHSSRGCQRCCTYGSKEQQKARAEWLAQQLSPNRQPAMQGLADALTALLNLDSGDQPRKLNQALSWRANDDLVRNMGHAALLAAKPFLEEK